MKSRCGCSTCVTLLIWPITNARQTTLTASNTSRIDARDSGDEHNISSLLRERSEMESESKDAVSFNASLSVPDS
ncbi:hypothetical protein BJ138DRAFT_1145902 [Hygrophoropsis aurantiaca]|uniref:Uncharacterized protein n=1 Tax=Hygrophoropsis aurantiaca TaxID=72124 RepID=A0ACB8AJ11_9AGAM|nr:hypothetical protein BJ138DRAFT_1145902 [Hygrophoropsis aurantiaca]